ncbi:MAG: cyclic nucleotide-binding domain-containing protein [Holophagales bacterium]|nr:cyclic nucleotide-binding domain-containing protein [Holophagales bacterium]
MKISGLESRIVEHPFFADLKPEYVDLLAGCASHVTFRAEEMIQHEGDPATSFFAIRHGRVAVEVDLPGRGPLVVETLGEGDILGWSWLFPPYTWRFDARAMELTRAFGFDCTCLRDKLDGDPAMGYEFMRRFAGVFLRRLAAARLQLIDLYGRT